MGLLKGNMQIFYMDLLNSDFQEEELIKAKEASCGIMQAALHVAITTMLSSGSCVELTIIAVGHLLAYNLG